MGFVCTYLCVCVCVGGGGGGGGGMCVFNLHLPCKPLQCLLQSLSEHV